MNNNFWLKIEIAVKSALVVLLLIKSVETGIVGEPFWNVAGWTLCTIIWLVNLILTINKDE